MSEITEDALNLIETFEVKRARDIDESILMSMTAPIVYDQEQNKIIKCFNSYLQDDKDGYLASYVVLSPTNIPLIFFSFRCGELFKELQVEKMKIAHNAWVALKKYISKKFESEEERLQALDAIKRANDIGLTPDEMEALSQKKESWKMDEELETTKKITKVLESYPAVELKLFGKNEAAKEYWKSLSLPKEFKMGETLFWLKAVPILKKVVQLVGCQYVYLFAADEEAEGQLVQYYRVQLGFKADSSLAANKPHFDWACQFLYQSTDELFNGRKEFTSKISKLQRK